MEYAFQKIIFFLNLNEIEKNYILYDIRYIILSYIYSNFKFIKFNNNNYEIFFENEKIQKNIFFKKIFKKKNIYIKINKNINQKEIEFLNNYYYSNYFENIDNFISYCLDMNLNEFVIFNNSLKFFKIKIYSDFNIFFLNIIQQSNSNVIDLREIKIKTLLYNYFG